MTQPPNLEDLYRQAQSALKAKEYERAGDLLTQILVVDENYRDASHLLAQTVRLKRRRWYTDLRLWATLGMAVLILMVVLIFPKIKAFYASRIPLSLAATSSLTQPATPTITPTLTPTPVPLAWKRIAMGQEFARDTVTGIAVDKNDPDVIYVGMMNAGIYKSIDGGLSWQPKYEGVANTHVGSLTIDPQNSKILYAGTWGGIFKTQDGGENWARIGEGYRLLMDPQNSSHLYAQVGGGGVLFESTDQGSTWEKHKSACPHLWSWAIDPQDGMTLFAPDAEEVTSSSCRRGVYSSSDGGRTWNYLGLDGPRIFSIAVGEDEQGNALIYAERRGEKEIFSPSSNFVSSDGGKSWRIQQTSANCRFLPVEPGLPETVYCSDSMSNVVVITAGKLSRTISTGGPSERWLTAFHADSYQGATRLIAGGQGLYISTDDGKSWSERSGGLGAARLELKIDPANAERMYLASYLGTDEQVCVLYRSDDNGKSWKQIMQGGHISWCGPVFDAVNTLYLLKEGLLERSTDGGNTWISSSLPSGEAFGSVSANPYLAGFLYAESHELYYSTDAGNSWQKATTSPVDWFNERFYYVQGGNRVYVGGELSFSTDGGRSWDSCGEGVNTPYSVSALVIDPGNDEHLYLADNGGGIKISVVGCRSWQPSNTGLGNLFVNSVALDPNAPDMIYAGTNGGVFVSYNAGQTWGQINDGLLGAVMVYSIQIESQSNVYAATPYGIFKLEGR